MKTVAILQSNYIPWRGYFDLIDQVDEFVLLDEVQFTRRDWRNRNVIKTAQGTQWLTIPVTSKGKYLQTISETEISDPGWASKHWKAIRLAYGKAPGFEVFGPFLEQLYAEAGKKHRLSDINRGFLEALCHVLDIDTALTESRDYRLESEKSERLLSVCRQAGATTYLSGPAAQDYLDVKGFAQDGIEVRWMDYGEYPSYTQLHGDFDPHVSIVDLLLNCGADARDYLKPISKADV